MPAKFQNLRAVVLRRTNFGEADRILSLITPSGQVSALARGARRAKSKLAGAIELLCLSDIVLVGNGNSSIRTISSASLSKQWEAIVKDYDRLIFAYEVLRQIERASREIDGGEWFNITVEVLSALDLSHVDFELIQAWFYLRLSAELGEPLNLQTDINGQKIALNQNYQYDVDDKGLNRYDDGSLTTNHIKLLRLMASGGIQLCTKVTDLHKLTHEVLSVCREHASLT